jgi:hypothetical protein
MPSFGYSDPTRLVRCFTYVGEFLFSALYPFIPELAGRPSWRAFAPLGLHLPLGHLSYACSVFNLQPWNHFRFVHALVTPQALML